MAFVTPEGSFKPIVVFFGPTNSPAIFQTMINEILWNLINTREVASFIDDVIVGIEEEERHNKIVEKIVKWLVENDFYMKLEKYKWKVRKVGLLEVVIELKGINMKKRESENDIRLANSKRNQEYTNIFGTR